MFKNLIKNKKAQNTAEYAILISLVVAGIIAMQTYAQRALQAKVRDASEHLKDSAAALPGAPGTAQYEPYYLKTDYKVERDEYDLKILDNGVVNQFSNSIRTRLKSDGSGMGIQESTYDAADGLVPGI